MLELSPIDIWQEFYDYFENSTEGFAVSELGYPWYWSVKETIYNSAGVDSVTKTVAKEVEQRRMTDCSSKLDLLGGSYDYVFFAKASMRTTAQHQVENPIWNDLYEYLTQKQKKFIIFELPDHNNLTDLKYLHSRHASVTIPWEFVQNLVSQSLEDQILERTQSFVQQVEDAFAKVDLHNRFSEKALEVKKKYFELAGVINRLVCAKALIAPMGAKAVFGGMGSHVSAGLDNDFSVVEIWHGYAGAWFDRENLHKPVTDYYQSVFNLKQYFNLALSDNDYIAPDDLCPPGQSFNYGMPDLRNYLRDEQRLNQLRSKYNLEGKKVVMIATSCWTESDKLERLITRLDQEVPNLAILLRPHPRYDNYASYDPCKEVVRFVPHEDKFDLFCICDAVISGPSSMVIEALKFTKNVICYPDRSFPSHGRKLMELRYPGARALVLDATAALVAAIKEMVANPKPQQPASHPVDSAAELEKLFNTINTLNNERRI